MPPYFTEVAADWGLAHSYQNGASGKLLMVEPTGGGAAWLDYDRDGWWDLYLNQGGDPTADPASSRPSDQLFRNSESRQFDNVTVSAGIDERGYSQGVAVGDFDEDGFDDLLVTNVAGNTLFRNQGDGTFQDVTEVTIGRDNLWSSSAAWADIDLDGDLDLYVCNYVAFDPFHPVACFNAKGDPLMCEPNRVQPVPDECYLNLGDGTFRRAARELGLFGPGNKALGVAIADFNNDEWPDIFVANDGYPNFLFISDRGKRFSEVAKLLGCAVSSEGRAQANMGIAVGDYDSNRFLDVYITHFSGEWNTLYQNLGPQGFQEISTLVGLAPRPWSLVGFGTTMADFNQDGTQELLVANGHLDDPEQLGILEMRPQCFTFDGRRWHDVSDVTGDYFRGRYVGRGLATADCDNDGDFDVVVVHQNRPAALLRNDSLRGHWLKLEFVGRRTNRHGIGVRVLLKSGDTTLMQEMAGGTTYCSAPQPALIFGLGAADSPCELEVRWPGGAVQMLEGVAVDQALVVTEPIQPTASETRSSPAGGAGR